MALIGYARVSTVEGHQLLDRQRDALEGTGCERIFDDHASGADPDRPGLAACLDHLRTGDVLVVLDLDRLGRLAAELVALVDGLESRGIGLRALNSPMDTTTPADAPSCRSRPRSPKWSATSSASACSRVSRRPAPVVARVGGRGP